MALEVTCSQCGKVYQVADQFAGRSAFCKSCGAQMHIAPVTNPGPYSVPPPVGAPMIQMPQQNAYFPPPQPVMAQPPRGGGFRLTKMSVFLFIIAAAMIFFGVQEMRLASATSSTPQQITCLELEKNGPGNNAYVTVSKFYNAPNYVYEKDVNNSNNWRRAWVPIVSQDGDYVHKIKVLGLTGKLDTQHEPLPDQITVLVKSDKIHNLADAQAMQSRGTVTGVVINKIESLKDKERQKMQEMYPKADLSRTWIIEEGREPAEPAKYYGLIGGGGFLALIGLATMYKKG